MCSVWGTTASRRRTLFSSTASCGSTVRRPGPVDAIAAFQRHLLGEDLQRTAIVSLWQTLPGWRCELHVLLKLCVCR